MRIYEYACNYLHMYMYIYIDVYAYICTDICIYVYMYMYIYTHVPIRALHMILQLEPGCWNVTILHALSPDYVHEHVFGVYCKLGLLLRNRNSVMLARAAQGLHERSTFLARKQDMDPVSARLGRAVA